MTKSSRKLTRELKSALKEEWCDNHWCLFSIGNCSKQSFDFKKMVKKSGPKLGMHSFIAEVYLDHKKDALASLMGAKWLEILKHAEIPFDLKTRREKLKHAYEDLAPYIAKHEALKKQREDEAEQGG